MKWISMILVILFLLLASSNSGAFILNKNNILNKDECTDYDPLIDLTLFIIIQSVRSFQIQMDQVWLEINVNNHSLISPVWNIDDFSNNSRWMIEYDIPDETYLVSIDFTLYDSSGLCDLNGKIESYQVHILFDVRTGHWSGDDYIGDSSGYGRLNGYDDKSMNQSEHDYEVIFDLFLNDYDSDSLPYYMEKYVYGTDPKINNSGNDGDNDSIPIEWEWRWNYDPFTYTPFSELDEDFDGLTGLDEYCMSQWGSDPFRKDVFLEIDQMQPGPNNIGSWMITKECKELLMKPFHMRNIMLHIHDGDMNEKALIPFEEEITNKELITVYNTYFLNNQTNHWKRNIFHYGLIIYHHEKAAGKAFIGEGFPINSNIRGINSFQVSKTAADETMKTNPNSADFIYATYIMHELGHSFGIDVFNPPGCDNKNTVHPLFFGWWLYKNYKSVMNYRYVHDIVDYSDGTHGKFDYDDWGNLDFNYFKLPTNNYVFIRIQQWYLTYLGLM